MSLSAKRPWGERLVASPWRILLFPLWLLYRPIIGIRAVAYDRGWLRPRRLTKPVISVGNIISGGSGKTPFVIFLCQLLKNHYQCHIISRGYKGDGHSNDEARLMPVPVHCNAKRIIAAQQAIDDGAELLIVDDGFQHRQLHRDGDIVLIDATRPWGHAGSQRGAVLPLGFLREHPRALRRADMIVISRSDQISAAQLQQLQQQLKRFGKPILLSRHQATHLSIQADNAVHELTELENKAVLCVSGLAHPQAFEQTATALGYQVNDQLRYPDHHHYQAADISEICQRAQDLQADVLCSSKDAVKLKPLWPAAAPTLYTLHVALQLNQHDTDLLLQFIHNAGQEKSGQS